MRSQSTENEKSRHSQTRLVSDRCCVLVNSFISLRVRKCGFTPASRAEIRIFTPRDIKFRTILNGAIVTTNPGLPYFII